MCADVSEGKRLCGCTKRSWWEEKHSWHSWHVMFSKADTRLSTDRSGCFRSISPSPSPSLSLLYGYEEQIQIEMFAVYFQIHQKQLELV